MTSKKNPRPGTHRVSDIEITKVGTNPDCVHHEILEQIEHGVLIGVCQHCQQERKYTPTYQNQWKHVNAA